MTRHPYTKWRPRKLYAAFVSHYSAPSPSTPTVSAAAAPLESQPRPSQPCAPTVSAAAHLSDLAEAEAAIEARYIKDLMQRTEIEGWRWRLLVPAAQLMLAGGAAQRQIVRGLRLLRAHADRSIHDERIELSNCGQQLVGVRDDTSAPAALKDHRRVRHRSTSAPQH